MERDARSSRQCQIALDYQNSVESKRKDRDGVVVTPVEVVDFQIRSALEQLKTQFNRAPDDDVEWLDPCGGTGIYTARLLQLVDLPPERKLKMSANCVMIEIDPTAAQIAANNLAQVLFEETGVVGAIRVICTDTLDLDPRIDLWRSDLPVVLPNNQPPQE